MNCPMKPVCDQGFLDHPAGVLLVDAMLTPLADQNQPEIDKEEDM